VGLKEAARAVDAEVVRQVQSFVSLAGSRLDARSREKLERRLDDLTQRLSQALDAAIEQDVRGAHSRWPFLSRLPDMFRRDTVAQERFLSLLTPWLFHGDEAWSAVDALASRSVGDALDGHTWHGVYSV
jgi:phage gp46-like protein